MRKCPYCKSGRKKIEIVKILHPRSYGDASGYWTTSRTTTFDCGTVMQDGELKKAGDSCEVAVKIWRAAEHKAKELSSGKA
jgi:hypothetical protein